MATVKWQAVATIYCQRVGAQATLVEERVYPNDVLPDIGDPFQVRTRRCNFGVECNLAGQPCRWSLINPDYDPFAR
jgi:hypothetical protein